MPYTEEKDTITSCGIPQQFKASKEFADKKVVLFAVPGAFTPGCSVRHLPGYIEYLNDIKGKGVDLVIVIAMNDAFVMSAWGKANGIKNDDIVSLPFCTACMLLTASVDVHVRYWDLVFEEHRLDEGTRADGEVRYGH